MGCAGCHVHPSTPQVFLQLLVTLVHSDTQGCPTVACTTVGDPFSLFHTCPMFWTINSPLGAELLSLPKWPGLCTFPSCIPSQAKHLPRILRDGRPELLNACQLQLMLQLVLQPLPVLCLPHISRHLGHLPILKMTEDQGRRHQQRQTREVGELSRKNRA